MVVFVGPWIIAKEREVVRVTAIAEGCHGVAAEFLPRRSKPALGPLPRVIGAVKLVGAKGAVAPGNEQIADAKPRTQPIFGRSIFVAVVAIVLAIAIYLLWTA